MKCLSFVCFCSFSFVLGTIRWLPKQNVGSKIEPSTGSLSHIKEGQFKHNNRHSSSCFGASWKPAGIHLSEGPGGDTGKLYLELDTWVASSLRANDRLETDGILTFQLQVFPNKNCTWMCVINAGKFYWTAFCTCLAGLLYNAETRLSIEGYHVYIVRFQSLLCLTLAFS